MRQILKRRMLQSKKYLPMFTLLLIIIGIDQLSKNYVLMGNVGTITITNFLNIVQVWNRGISFGLFSGEYSNIIFMFLTGMLILLIIYFSLKSRVLIIRMTYILILGGAFGNLIDRIRYDAVFDFIDLHIAGYHWPAFNIADSVICLGGAMLLRNIIFNKKDLELYEK